MHTGKHLVIFCNEVSNALFYGGCVCFLHEKGRKAHPLDLEDLYGGAQVADLLSHFLRQAGHSRVQFGVVLDVRPSLHARRLLCCAESLAPKQAWGTLQTVSSPLTAQDEI